MKKFVADVWKIIFNLTLNSMESYPEHLVVYYKFLKKFKSLAYVFNFQYIFIARAPFYCKKIAR